MAKYLKHYWKKNGNWLTTSNEVEQHHQEAEYPGLGVKIWTHDSDGVDVCLSEVPDDVTITDVVDDSSGKKAVQELTEEEFNSVQTPFTESQTLRQEAQQETDETLKADLEAQADTKFQEAQAALYAL